jgi:hypothetical protein
LNAPEKNPYVVGGFGRENPTHKSSHGLHAVTITVPGLSDSKCEGDQDQAEYRDPYDAAPAGIVGRRSEIFAFMQIR